jgi:glycosyltransferase involved in cell wall biosynthesis
MNGYTGSKTPEVIPNYSRDLGYDMNRDVKIKSLKISFIGKMSYEPNVNAVKHFVNNVFLEIKKTYPDLEFHIIGPNPSKYIKSLENVTGIKVRGFVDDPAYELMSSKLIVAPMRSGSGMQNKILESMYLGKVVVTNHLGISGFDNISDNEIVICESDLDMISKINSLLNDKNSNMISEIGSNARKYVISNYSFDFVQQKYLSLF